MSRPVSDINSDVARVQARMETIRASFPTVDSVSAQYQPHKVLPEALLEYCDLKERLYHLQRERDESNDLGSGNSENQTNAVEAAPVEVPRAPGESPDRSTRRTKVEDFSRYLLAAGLTSRQYECCSLKWEYGLSDSAIAKELNLHRSTVEQHIESGQEKMRRSGQYEQVRKRVARDRPG